MSNAIKLQPKRHVHASAGSASEADAMPLGSYAGFLVAYGVSVTGAGAVLRRRRGFPERISASDLALITVATHKLSRLIAKESVTRPLRAPFTTFVDAAGEAELNETVDGTGMRKAIGEWITCPFCLSQWLATAFTFGIVAAPRPTRMAATVLTAVAGSDWLQLAYAAARARVEPSGS
jgi:hypothetical protein